MFDRDGKLDIFEAFETDRSLPKFKETKSQFLGAGIVVTSSRAWAMQNSTLTSGEISERRTGYFWPDLRLAWRRFLAWVRDERAMPIEQFFRSVKNGVEELELVDHRMQGYLAAVAQARANGQIALAEQLEEGVEGVRAETQMFAIKLRKYITEEQLVSFVKKAKRGLRLDWIKNFTRVVPEAVVKTKQAADARGIFDNYVVLHYDPKKKAWSETKEERERRKDPILFGVVRGRRRLYFVGDWVDEYCDLTLDQLADVLGEKPGDLPKAFDVGHEQRSA